MKQNSFLYGAVLKLTREDTLETIECNLRQMRESGLDTVVVWPAVYWWEEKRQGYPFNTGKEVLKLAEKHGISVIMELAGQLPMMEAIPDFLMKDDYYCLDEKGHKCLAYNSFGWLNYLHPEVNALICQNFAETAKAYKDFPALIAYDVFNETAFSSYDDYTLGYFRRWLKEKYSCIDRLNAVWERSYTEFEQVSFAPWMWMSIAPAADFGAFRKDCIKIYLKNWCDAIRAVDSTRPLIADNIGSMITNGAWGYERPQDDFALAEVADEIGMSFYPKQVTATQKPSMRWNVLDAFYAASGRKGFYLSEMQTHIQALFNPTTAVRPLELKQWCYEAYASGIKGLIYWMWRPFTKGLQTAGRGLVDYKNRSTPRLEFASQFADVLGELHTLTPRRSKVGILFDPRCQDFQTFYTKCYKVDQNIYLNSLRGAYDAFFDAGVRADVIRLPEIKAYPLVILSNQIVLDKESAKLLEQYVREGGRLLCDGKIGVVDEYTAMNEQLPGGAFNACMGHEWIDSDYENLDFVLDQNNYEGHYGRELTRVTDGEVLAQFADGAPAVIRKPLGLGEVITVNTYLWYGYKAAKTNANCFARSLAERMDLYEVRVSAPLTARISENEDTCVLFVFNYTNTDVTGRVCGGGFDEEVTVPANDVILLKKEKKQ